MKMIIARFFVLFVAMNRFANAQGSFQNLNFESAYDLPASSPASVPVTNALPGWIVYQGGVQESQMIYNAVSLGAVEVTIVGTNPYSGNPALAGNYSVTLDAGSGNSGPASASITQTGLIPGVAKSLQFLASGDVSDIEGSLAVSFNGQNLQIFELLAGANYNEYGVNISAYAGQTGTLEFTENPGNPPVEIFGITYLDNISFSPSQVPEPSAWTLILFGAGLFGAARYAKSRNKI